MRPGFEPGVGLPMLFDEANPDTGLEGTHSADFQWPKPLDERAFHGLAGEIVRTIEPASEADPAALLIQTLVACGNIFGYNPHFQVEDSRHGTNLFAAVVGRTSKSRKGTSWGRVLNLMAGIDADWSETRVYSGLSSGEGLIWAVRDAFRDDEGVRDKRLLVVESEFASTLKVMSREGNTLSATLRQAWDSGRLSTMTKKCPGLATDTHISIIAHITRDELRRYLTETEMGNGFGNRFLWICANRSKCLPEGGLIPREQLEHLVAQLKSAFEFSRNVSEVQREGAARAIWASAYKELSDGGLGLFGAMTSRAEAQVMRLATIYALLDQSVLIQAEHLKAGLAVWEYCEASAKFIFGDALGDPLADRILGALHESMPDCLSRTKIRDLLGRNRHASEIDRALQMLAEIGKARREIK